MTWYLKKFMGWMLVAQGVKCTTHVLLSINCIPFPCSLHPISSHFLKMKKIGKMQAAGGLKITFKKVHETMYSNKVPRAFGGETGPQHHRSSTILQWACSAFPHIHLLL
ncbi:hypothetical protein XENORESO_007487 [Xenotaenia resolanae]|uniref:Uncharacterized protein n=1 Tax=Xenotaenia resolanae TaxID=208358 RepID=A0ABV0WAH9_9TELE